MSGIVVYVLVYDLAVEIIDIDVVAPLGKADAVSQLPLESTYLSEQETSPHFASSWN